MRLKKVCFSVAVAVAFVSAFAATGQDPKPLVPTGLVPVDSRPTEFKIRLEFVGEKQVDLRGKELYFSGGIDGKLVGQEKPKLHAPLPVKVRFEKVLGKDLKLSSRDYAFALLNDKGEVVERELRLGFPFASDPKTGFPSEKIARDIVISDKSVNDDPQLSLWRGNDGIDDKGEIRGLRVKSGHYTLVVAIRDQIATVSFKVIGD